MDTQAVPYQLGVLLVRGKLSVGVSKKNFFHLTRPLIGQCKTQTADQE